MSWSLHCDAFHDGFPLAGAFLLNGTVVSESSSTQGTVCNTERLMTVWWSVFGTGRAGPVSSGSPRVHRTVTNAGGQRRARLRFCTQVKVLNGASTTNVKNMRLRVKSCIQIQKFTSSSIHLCMTEYKIGNKRVGFN